MSAASMACAPSGVAWDGINWADVQRQVRRLQARTVNATQTGKHNKAKALQWLRRVDRFLSTKSALSICRYFCWYASPHAATT
jgi:N-terminal domain of reverse transcriptase